MGTRKKAYATLCYGAATNKLIFDEFRCQTGPPSEFPAQVRSELENEYHFCSLPFTTEVVSPLTGCLGRILLFSPVEGGPEFSLLSEDGSDGHKRSCVVRIDLQHSLEAVQRLGRVTQPVINDSQVIVGNRQ